MSKKAGEVQKLGKLCFERMGAEWRSKEADEMLRLFVRKLADKAHAHLNLVLRQSAPTEA